MKFNLSDCHRFELGVLAQTMVRLRKHSDFLRKNEVELDSQLQRSKTTLQCIENQLLNALEAIKGGEDLMVSKVAIESLYRLQKERIVASEAVKVVQLNISGLRAEMKSNDSEIDILAEEIDQLVQGD